MWGQETEFPRELHWNLLIARRSYFSWTQEALPVWAQCWTSEAQHSLSSQPEIKSQQMVGSSLAAGWGAAVGRGESLTDFWKKQGIGHLYTDETKWRFGVSRYSWQPLRVPHSGSGGVGRRIEVHRSGHQPGEFQSALRRLFPSVLSLSSSTLLALRHMVDSIFTSRQVFLYRDWILHLGSIGAPWMCTSPLVQLFSFCLKGLFSPRASSLTSSQSEAC